MTVEVELVVGFVLAVVRASAWVAVVPPFHTRLIPVPVKVGLAVALALPVAPRLAEDPPTEAGPLLVAVLVQVTAGLALGFLTQLLFTAVQAAGELLDLFVGYTIASTYDPFTGATQAVLGRFFYLLAATLLFAVDGHLLLVRGFLDSYAAVPADADALAVSAEVVLGAVTTFFLAAVQLAAPLLGALFLAEVALGLLARAAPMMNVFVLGFPAKILLALGLVGLVLPHLPDVVVDLVTASVRSGAAVARLLA